MVTAVAAVVDVEEVAPPSSSTSGRSSLWRSLLGREAQHSMEERMLRLG
jgi:hypothetical protein